MAKKQVAIQKDKEKEDNEKTITVYFGRSPIPRQIDKKEAKRLLRDGKAFEVPQVKARQQPELLSRVIIFATGELKKISQTEAAKLVTADEAIYYYGPTVS